MKYLIVIGNGLSDRPLPDKDNQTPLQLADTPHLDRMARIGQTGSVRTIPEGLPPGPEVSLLGLLGYDPAQFRGGAGHFLARALDVPVGDGEMPLCCDFIVLQSSHNDMVMKDYTGDRLSPQDAETLIGALQESVVSETVRFHSGGGYQNLMVMRSGPLPGRLEPPQELVGEGIRKFIPQDRPYRELVHLMNEAQIILHNHPLNRRRLAENQDAVNSVWFWGNGEPRELPPFEHRFGRSASVVTAAPLLRGMAVAAGMDAPRVAGATGFADTDYGMKLETAWRELETHDVVYLHLSGGEPVSLQGMIDDKIMVIEDFDEKIVGPLLREAERRGDLHLLVTEAQMTSVDRMKYEDNPVPFVVHTPQGAAGGQDRFDEDLVDGAGGRYASGPDLIEAFLKEAV